VRGKAVGKAARLAKTAALRGGGTEE